MRFFLGTTEPHWLEFADVPLFLSARRLRDRRPKTVPVSVTDWALDSGGFTELNLYSAWQTPPAQYAAEAQRWQREIGRLQWASPQDWMCEPFMVEKTGLSVVEHQRRTVDNFFELVDLAPDVPWIPVLQGWELADYERCIEMYGDHGLDLTSIPTVGLGSVCRRQAMEEARDIVAALSSRGLRLHGFGFKMKGLELCGNLLKSADSLAWSLNARKNPPLPGCVHKTCNTCWKWARHWYDKVIEVVGGPLPPSTLPFYERFTQLALI